MESHHINPKKGVADYQSEFDFTADWDLHPTPKKLCTKIIKQFNSKNNTLGARAGYPLKLFKSYWNFEGDILELSSEAPFFLHSHSYGRKIS